MPMSKGEQRLFCRLQTLADGINRKNIEGALQPKEKDDDYSNDRVIKPFQRDSNFDDQDFSDRIAHRLDAVKTPISGLAKPYSA